jgi:predicted Zn-dependent peptidase
MTTEIFKINGVNCANIKSDSEIAFFGVSCLAGSNYETPNEAGISHYIEHCHFKQTTSRNWQQINSEFAKLGVSQNAYTSSSDVLYFATCPKENIAKVINLMSDMFFNSTFPEDEIEKERNVIIEEKKMYDDDPKSYFSEVLGEQFFTWSMGHRTIGTFDTIKSINRQQMMDYLKDKISLENMVFICSGNIDTSDLKKYLKKNIPSSHPYLKNTSLNVVANNDKLWNLDVINKPSKIKFIMERENVTQSIATMMINGLPNDDKYSHHASIVTEATGGGMYSLLFENIREKLGLCYSVGMYESYMSYPNNKVQALYGYLSPNNVDLFIEECEKVLRKLIKNGIDKDLFECAKTDYLSSILRQTETSTGKAMFLTKRLLFYKDGNIEDVIKKIRSVKLKDCNSIIERLFDVPYNWAIMNPKE